MNAYELADEIQDAYCEGKKLTDVANMLRQQAEKINNMEIWEKKYLDRIEELEKKHPAFKEIPYGEFILRFWRTENGWQMEEITDSFMEALTTKQFLFNPYEVPWGVVETERQGTK